MKVIIFALGNRIRYAPKTPEIAPEAPTAGVELNGSITICAKPATIPQKR